MNLPIGTRYALRSLLRHRRRTFLSIVGIGVGCAICLFLVSFVRGESDMMLRAAAESGTGHLRIAPRAWLLTHEQDLRLGNWQQLLEKMRSSQFVEVAAPHARIDALLAMGTRTAGVLMLGVDPEVEPEINRLIDSVVEGKYLHKSETGAVVIGRGVAERLNVDVGDALVVTVSGRGGEMRSAMLRVQGIVATGSRSLDNNLCHVTLVQMAELSGYEGAAEISILLDDPDQMEEAAAAISSYLPEDQVVVSWKLIMPELASGVEVDKTWTRLIIGIVIFVVFLGIASAQLAAALERRKEFAVLAAIGMRSRRLVRVMLAEGFILGLAGALLSLLIGVPLVYLISIYGIDFGGLYAEADLGISNILLDPIIYGDFGWWLAPLAFGLAITATILSSLYPAWYAGGTNPAAALRVEQ